MLKRLGIWGGAIVLLGLMVWGLANLATPNPGTSDVQLTEGVGGTDHIKGNSLGKLVLVEYSDFQCPACANFSQALKNIYPKYQNQVLFVYRHFPLPQHDKGLVAAKASEAAANQGKFWEMHDLIFDNQSAWGTNDKDYMKIFESYATQLGLNLEQFRSDLNSRAVEERVEKDIQSGMASGVNATPTFYLNGKKVTNLQSYGDLDVLIGRALAQ